MAHWNDSIIKVFHSLNQFDFPNNVNEQIMTNETLLKEEMKCKTPRRWKKNSLQLLLFFFVLLFFNNIWMMMVYEVWTSYDNSSEINKRKTIQQSK